MTPDLQKRMFQEELEKIQFHHETIRKGTIELKMSLHLDEAKVCNRTREKNVREVEAAR